jgi:hypothetical protein
MSSSDDGRRRKWNVVIVEIKRAELPRLVLAQAIDYASAITDWSVEKFGEICLAYTERTLQEVFESAFPDVDLESGSFNDAQRIIQIGFSIDASMERMIRNHKTRRFSIGCIPDSSGMGDAISPRFGTSLV